MSSDTQLSPQLEQIALDLEEAAIRLGHARRRSRRLAGLTLAAGIAVTLTLGSALAASGLVRVAAPFDVGAAVRALWSGHDTWAPPPGKYHAVARFGQGTLYRDATGDPSRVCLAFAIGSAGDQHLSLSGCVPRVARDGHRLHGIGGGSVGPDASYRYLYGQLLLPPGGSLWFERVGDPPIRVYSQVDGFYLWGMPVHSPSSVLDPPPARSIVGRFTANPPVIASLVIRDASGAIVQSQPIQADIVPPPI